jgi:uncharacterized protein DUF6580
MLGPVKEKWKSALPYVFMLVAAVSRWPGLLPMNFSAFYALSFCAGAFFPRSTKWWLPLGTLLVTDTALDLFYYHASLFTVSQLFNYAAFAGLIWFGGRFGPRASFLRLLGGGIFGAIAFYLVTNTAAWLFNPFHNPEYTQDLRGWFRALTMGTAGYPPTLEFFWKTLLSGGLFTGLFAGAMKLSEATEREPEKPEEDEPASRPEEAEAVEPQDA